MRERFPGDTVRQVVLQRYGDDPEIEPGELWVRVLLRADRPEDYDQVLRKFDHDHQAALEEFMLYLAEELREICMVEFTFGNDPVTNESLGPSNRMQFGPRLADVQAWRLGEATEVRGRMGQTSLETLDTMIMAGIADYRADAIRCVLARFRQQPEYEQFRERVREIHRLRAEFLDAGQGLAQGVQA